MTEAAKIARNNVHVGEGGPFGAVVVLNSKIIGRGQNKVTSDNDPTAHAEIVAIRDACANRATFDLSGFEIYSSCEPCPMCLSAIYWARIEKIYYANSRWDATKIGFDDAEIYKELKKDLKQRKIQMVHIPDEVATEAFLEWEHKTDKILY